MWWWTRGVVWTGFQKEKDRDREEKNKEIMRRGLRHHLKRAEDVVREDLSATQWTQQPSFTDFTISGRKRPTYATRTGSGDAGSPISPSPTPATFVQPPFTSNRDTHLLVTVVAAVDSAMTSSEQALSNTQFSGGGY
ncbi:hypothetical protein E3N88_32935 [Mikania micrantha]|uniref:Uncharacterized protein n=1 Tax=Mikania micrantha TaxID=192012 RepID=A0A5N6M9T0_9ASTR|nr:hypothetical protein E3N88_32935 [Mikania micrantha]